MKFTNQFLLAKLNFNFVVKHWFPQLAAQNKNKQTNKQKKQEE